MHKLLKNLIFILIASALIITGCINKTPEKPNESDTPALPDAMDNLAPTPPMGWNSWNPFGKNVSEQVIRETADAMVNSGLKDAGFTYLVIDDYWQGTRDTVTGVLNYDPERFPSGIKALADYVHSKGLKFGIYSDAGTLTCGDQPGSYG